MNNRIDINDVGQFLKKHEIKPSYQRIKIFQYLLDSVEHPHVDEIYRTLIEEIPTLSKTTVYNTLNLFVEKGIVNSVTIDGNETRYDADIREHGHFRCDACGKVYDFEAQFDQLQTDLPGHFIVSQRDIFFRGICDKCNKKN